MKRLLLALACVLSCSFAFSRAPAVKTGIEVLRDNGFDILKGKRVGLITNPTGVDATLRSSIDILFAAPDMKLVALFGPEHGVRGEFAAGDNVDNYIDAKTSLPVYSLYGKTHKPTAEMLKDIDILVYDIQDIGCRSYTYISTMGLAMEAAAERKIPFVVLDRPNPLGGLKVEGNLVEPGFKSFIGLFPIPYVYGLTCGELARLLNEEKMLTDGARCELVVVSMKGWKRDMDFPRTGLPWVPTSPHVPAEDSPAYYVSTGVLGELGVVSEGVGYTIPFHTLAAEWIDPHQLASRMNALKLPGILFRPIVYKPFYGRFTGKLLKGVQLHITDYSQVNLLSIQFLFLQVHAELHPDKNPFSLAGNGRIGMFDKAAGTDKVRKLLGTTMRYADIKGLFTKDVDSFKTRSKKYWLYQ